MPTNTVPYKYLQAVYSGSSLIAPIDNDILVKEKKELSKTKNYHEVFGRLISNDEKRSLPDTKINFFVKDLLGVKYYLGTATSGSKGEFSFRYLWDAGFRRNHHIVMGIVERKLPFALAGVNFKEEVVLQKINRTIPAKTAEFDLGDISVSYADISQNINHVKKPLASHQQPLSYYWKLFKAIAPEIPKKAFVSIFGRWLTTAQVQKLYDIGPAYIKRPNTIENMIDELLNQINAVDPRVDGNQVTWTANWDGLTFDKDYSLPNVTVFTNKNDSGKLILDNIKIKFRNEPKEFIVKADDKNIEWATYVARSTFALKGEAELHLAEGHILPGVIATSFFKYIKPGNPLYSPAQPHLSQVDFINWLGSKGVIFGSGSVLDLSALDDKSIADVIIKSIKEKADWLNYTPPDPLTKDHYHARAEALHFNLLWLFFDRYINDHKDAIIKSWSSIYALSESIHNLIGSIPRLTNNENTPSGSDLSHLAKFMAWLISKTTFVHWAAHSRQQLLTDLSQATLSIENQALDPNGNLHPYGNTSPQNASKQLFFSRLLLNFQGDSFFENPNGDMDQGLLKLFREHIGNFEGYDDIMKMHITTQI